MNEKLKICICNLILLFGIATISNGYMCSQTKEDTVSIVGTVKALEWDENDNITAVVISVETALEDTTEEAYEIIDEEYYVSDNIKGRELLKMVGETVEATGSVEEDDEGNKTIHVLSYQVIREE